MDVQVTRFTERQGDYAAVAQNITVAAFSAEDVFILNIESEKTEDYVVGANCNFCTLIKQQGEPTAKPDTPCFLLFRIIRKSEDE